MDQVLELEIPARAEFVALVRLVVSSVASTRRVLADERIDDLKLAVSEACTNAIEAHDAVKLVDHVVVRLTEGDDRLEVNIDDRGGGFDPDSLPEHPPVTDPERLNFERGLGIPLIRTLVDEVEFDSSNTGTSVRLTIFCGRAKIDELGEL
ncbi:MAG: serine/threonine-protein kinase RsbW [Acidimicrobiaceae bacterium]|nr:serine/threonine-protein kinase RsbW [Acidimicrobiaceae bacterium]